MDTIGTRVARRIFYSNTARSLRNSSQKRFRHSTSKSPPDFQSSSAVSVVRPPRSEFAFGLFDPSVHRPVPFGSSGSRRKSATTAAAAMSQNAVPAANDTFYGPVTQSRVRMESCTFCQIVSANDPNVVLEPRSNHFAVIRDQRPAATHHFLIVAHQHIHNAKSLLPNDQDRALLTNMISAAKRVLAQNGCDLNNSRIGFHWPPFYSVSHLHLHVIGPVTSMSFIQRYIVFNPWFSWVFVDANYVRHRIGCEEPNETAN